MPRDDHLLCVQGRQINLDLMKSLHNNKAFNNAKLVHAYYITDYVLFSLCYLNICVFIRYLFFVI